MQSLSTNDEQYGGEGIERGENNETISQNKDEWSDDNETNCNEDVDGNEDVDIFSDSLAVQILSRLDEYAYKKAIDDDAKSINENYLLILSFPWRQGARLPKKALKAMPRDIDELHAITHCDGNLHAPFGDFNGHFGFGRYENGQSRGNYGVRQASLEESMSQSVGSTAVAAARRSDDPGVIELAVQLPLPPSIDSIDLTPTQWKERLIWENADNAEALSRLPYTWERKKKATRLNENPDKPCATSIDSFANATIPFAEAPSGVVQLSSEKLRQSNSEAKREREFSMACIRKWKISTRVDRVSTRSSLFPSSTVVDYDSADNSKRKVVRPMLCCGVLAQEVQTGQLVSVEKALELDEEGLLSYRLGSYDCRFLEKLITTKKESVIRSKRVEVGRTRLVWTNVIQGDEPFTPSTRNRIAYNSLLTGRRIDPTRVPRPREVKVGVRVDGKLIMEEAIEDVEVNTGSSKKRKHSTRQAVESEILVKKPSMECPTTRTEEQIEDAFDYSLATMETLRERSFLEKTTENGAVVYLDLNSKSSTPAQIDRRAIIASLLKFKRHKKVMHSSVQVVSPHSLKSYAPPRFALLPLEDGILRSVCMSSGKMLGSAVHELIRDVSRNDSMARCSVCWSDEGAGQEGVHECSSCGLLAHLSCCLDKGQFVAVSNDELNLSNNMTLDRREDGESYAIDCLANPNRPNSLLAQWHCAVCCQYSEKPRRIARLPSRFKDDDVQESTKESDIIDSTTSMSKNIPGPRCTLCPHRGGAMSLLEPKDSQQWAHEVCRVWSNADVPENEELGTGSFHRYPKFLSSACALCGGGGVKRGKSENFHHAGLVQCAARGCYVAFHPMCALIASKTYMDEIISVPTRKTRVSIEQATEEKKSEEEDDRVVEDRKLCNEYTLQLVKLVRTEGNWPKGKNGKTLKTAIIPVAFCGLHNPRRDSSFYGCLPGGGVMEE